MLASDQAIGDLQRDQGAKGSSLVHFQEVCQNWRTWQGGLELGEFVAAARSGADFLDLPRAYGEYRKFQN